MKNTNRNEIIYKLYDNKLNNNEINQIKHADL